MNSIHISLGYAEIFIPFMITVMTRVTGKVMIRNSKSDSIVCQLCVTVVRFR